jgi:alpha-ketoglutarate-dependent taurine dioxygenase
MMDVSYIVCEYLTSATSLQAHKSTHSIFYIFLLTRYHSFMNDREILLTQVAQKGWHVVSGITVDADNAALLALGKLLGTTSMQGTRSGAPNLENDGVNRVEAMDEPMRDAAGNPVLSSNSDEFPLHTDDSYNLSPARYVLMHCWQNDASTELGAGGESWLSHVNHIVSKAPTDLVDRLIYTPYPTPFGQATILQRARSQQGIEWQVRFNRRDMQSFAKLRGKSLSEQQLSDLAEFETLASQCMERLRLQPGDCIIVDNRRALHGRSAFNPASGRLIKRLRIQ